MLAKRFTQPKDWQWGGMVNADRVALRYGRFQPNQNPAANIIIGPGLSEFGEKYFETARILGRLGYNVYVLHWRGQGGSPSYLKDRFRRHSLGFDRDARDLLQFSNEIVPDTAPKVLLAHSMGGLIGLLALVKQPEQFCAAILCAPLQGFVQPPARGNETVIAKLPLPRRLLESYIPGGHPWRARTDPAAEHKPQAFSSDPVRMHLHDYWMRAKPDLQVGSPTLGFVREASRAITELRRPSVIESIATPLLVFSAGDDRVVRTQAIFNLAARLPEGSHLHLPDAKHEILLEADRIRRPALKNIHNFIRSTLA